MLIFLVLLGAASVLELILVLGWRWRRILASLAVVLLALSAGGMLFSRFNSLGLLVFLATGFRVFNLLRIVEHRLPEQQLRHSSRQTSLLLMVYQLVVLSAWFILDNYLLSPSVVWNTVVIIQLAGATLLLMSTIRSFKKTKFPKIEKHFSDSDLPSVTVAVPARNEDAQLDESIQAILSSDYPKLEVIVLDDCSHDRTPEIIRKFAHDGARFVGGVVPDEDWLAKNYAYQKLLDESSGEIILFCGVDMRFEPSTVRQLVTTMLVRDKKMFSIVPLNFIRSKFLIIKPMRYFWELALPRRQLQRPPVISSCWLIRRDVIEGLGGFHAVRKSIVPEAYFARMTMQDHDGYSFLRSSNNLGLTSAKPLSEQRATAMRVRYPQLHQRPEMVYLISVAELFFLVVPFVIALTGYSYTIGLLAEALAVISSLMLIVINFMILRVTFPGHGRQALVSFPIAAIIDVLLVNYSMYKYEFSEVIWKERNVCQPIMQVIPHLPDANSPRTNSARKH